MSPYRTLNPTTGQTEKVFDLHTTHDMIKKLEHAHHFWQHDWRRRSITDRSALLSKAADILRTNKEHHARLISIEMGKVLSEAVWEIELSADILTYYANMAETFLKPRELPVTQGKAVVLSEPLGVIYCVEPWNFPYYQLARVAAPNLMAGNVVMVKHAPGVPQCALAFETLFQSAGLPAGAIPTCLSPMTSRKF